jgi:hypothetical protein
VRELFVRVNRLLAPANLKDAFELYIVHSLTEEMDRVAEYYSERKGGFWVAVDGQKIVGMFGLESSGEEAMSCAECTLILIPDAGGLLGEC